MILLNTINQHHKEIIHDGITNTEKKQLLCKYFTSIYRLSKLNHQK